MKARQTPSRGGFALRLATLAVVITLNGLSGAPPSRGETSDPPRPPVLPSDPWQAGQIMTAEDLTASLSKAAGDRPLVLYVGPRFSYEGGHIAGSSFAGPASKPEGIQALKDAVKSFPREGQVVLYCGCCPWKVCPNVRPAFRTLQDLGFTNVRVLYLPTNLRRDWTDKGLPTQKGGSK